MHNQPSNEYRHRVLIIYNPIAGQRHRHRVERTLDLLRRQGALTTIQETTARGDAETYARLVDRRDWDVLVVAGGDGTINEVVNGLGDDAPPLALLPIGTANVLAAEIGLDLSPAAIAAAIVGGRPTTTYLGQAGRQHFIMMAGCGFDAEVVAGVDPAVKRRIGKGAYVLESLRQMLRYRFPWFQVTVDGRAYRAASAIVANGHFYAGRFVSAPAARLTDATLHVCLFTRTGLWNVVRYAWGLWSGRLHRFSDVEIVAGREILLDGKPGDPVQADGDLIGELPVPVRVAERRLTLLYPPTPA